MNTNPAVAEKILRNFSIAAVTAVSAVFAADRIVHIASREQMEAVEDGNRNYTMRVYNHNKIDCKKYLHLSLSCMKRSRLTEFPAAEIPFLIGRN